MHRSMFNLIALVAVVVLIASQPVAGNRVPCSWGLGAGKPNGWGWWKFCGAVKHQDHNDIDSAYVHYACETGSPEEVVARWQTDPKGLHILSACGNGGFAQGELGNKCGKDWAFCTGAAPANKGSIQPDIGQCMGIRGSDDCVWNLSGTQPPDGIIVFSRDHTEDEEVAAQD